MKLTKNTVIRVVALILFMSMILAIILYDGGAYDFSFVKRPVVYTTVGETTGGGDGPDETTGGDNTTVTQPPMDDDEIKEILSKIKTLDDALKEGYALSYERFGSSSALAKVDAPYLEGEFSISSHTVSKRVFYEIANGSLGVKKETRVEDLPRIRFYYGYAIVNVGIGFSIYNKEGNKVADLPSIELPCQKTHDGLPVVNGIGVYYKITDEGLTEIQASDIKQTPINLDAPRYYAKSNIDLYPFKARVMELKQIGVVTTEPPATTPEETTDPDGTTEPDSTTEPGGTTDPDATTDPDITTTPNDTTVPSDTTTSDTTDAPVLRNVRTVTTESDSTSSDTTEGETTAPENTTADTTEGETTAPENTTEGETTSPDTDTPPDTELPEGAIIEKDGKIYEVTYRELYGYKNSKGEVKIKPQYTMAYDFTSDGLACVIYENYRLLFIDTKGNRVVSLIGNEYVSPSDFNYKKHYQTYFAGINNDYHDMGMYYFNDGYAIVRYALLDAKTASKLVKTVNLIVDKTGTKNPVPGYYNLEGFSDTVMLVEKDGRYGYMNLDHSWVFHPVFDEAFPFCQGLAVAHTEDGYGMIDTEGNVILPFIFKHISSVSDGRIAAYSEELGWQIYTVVSK